MLRHLRSAVIAVSKRAPWFRRAVRKGLRATRSTAYQVAHRSPVRERTIVFESFMGRSYSGSPRAIYERALKDGRFADWSFVWAFLEPAVETSFFPELRDPRTNVVMYRDRAYHEASATAQWMITNSIMPDYIFPREGQGQIQTWHGTAFKRLGADIIDDTATATNDKNDIVSRYRRASEQATYILSSSPFTSRTFTSAFAMSDDEASRKLVHTGNPRNDDLVNVSSEAIAAVREKFSIPEGKKVVLYAPTWRDDQHSSAVGYTYRLDVDFHSLRERLGDEYIVLFRVHYLVSSRVDLTPFDGFVIDVSLHDEVNDLYLAADLLVTDYSSVFFDYALLDRPVIFHMYDLDHYRDRLRGLYLELDELPGPVCQSEAELADLILGVDARQEAEAAKRARFRAEFTTFDDGQATARVLDVLLGDHPASTTG